MSGERHAASAFLGVEERVPRLEELVEEPAAEVDPRRDPDDEHEQQRLDACVGIQDEERTEDGGDRAARPEHRDPRVGLGAEEQRDRRLRHGRGEPAGDVEQQKAQAAEGVLDVLAEDREEEQVAEDVVPARMEEHRREPADRPRLRRVARVVNVAGVERRLANGAVEVGKLVEHPHREVRGDQCDGHDRKPSRPHSVRERQHLAAKLGTAAATPLPLGEGSLPLVPVRRAAAAVHPRHTRARPRFRRRRASRAPIATRAGRRSAP